MSNLVWAYKKLQSLHEKVGFVKVTDAEFSTLMTSGDAQDPRIGGRRLKYIDYSDTTSPPIAKPDKVTGITTSGVTTTEIELDWDAMARAASYHISVTPAVAGYPKDVSVNNYGVQGLTAATPYTFKIKACNVTGCGAETQKTETTATA